MLLASRCCLASVSCFFDQAAEAQLGAEVCACRILAVRLASRLFACLLPSRELPWYSWTSMSACAACLRCARRAALHTKQASNRALHKKKKKKKKKKKVPCVDPPV